MSDICKTYLLIRNSGLNYNVLIVHLEDYVSDSAGQQLLEHLLTLLLHIYPR